VISIGLEGNPYTANAVGGGLFLFKEERPMAIDERIQILAWLSIPDAYASLERFRELAECGFTTSFTVSSSESAVAAALDLAQSVGVKLIISCPELSADPENTVNRFKSHPALAGYFLFPFKDGELSSDEPHSSDFPKLAALSRTLQGIDDKHYVYVNLLPEGATPDQYSTANYQDYIEAYVKAHLPVPSLSFDLYPIQNAKDGYCLPPGCRVNEDWYSNLELFWLASHQTGKPIWAFALSTAHYDHPYPDIHMLRLQVHSNLAYGAQCIQYFTYWTPANPSNPLLRDGGFFAGPIDVDGTQNGSVYNLVRQMNSEIQHLAPVFANAKVLSVGHTGVLPRGTRPFRPTSPVTSIQTDGLGAVVSRASKGDQCSLIVVNRDFTALIHLKVLFDDTSIVHLYKLPTPELVVGGQYETTLEPSGICVFSWPKKMAPLEFVQFGEAYDRVPIIGVWDGSRRSKPGVYRPPFFHLGDEDGFTLNIVQFGEATDSVPIIGDWDGSGRDKPGVYRPPFFHLGDEIGRTIKAIKFGEAYDKVPIIGDWDGSGRDKPGVYRPPFFHLGDEDGRTIKAIKFGEAYDKAPIIGDWDGSGRDKPGVYRPPFFHLGDEDGRTIKAIQFGEATDTIPIIGDWDGSGKDQPGVYRPPYFFLGNQEGRTIQILRCGESTYR